MGIRDGVALMRASYEVVRRRPALLWFPVASTCCLALTALFWIFEGVWLYAVRGPWLAFVALAMVGLYALVFVGIFFNVALAGATAEALAGREPSFGAGLALAWSRLGAIAGWALYSATVAIVLGAVEGIKGVRWVGKAAEVAWNFATFFVVPLIALEGLDASEARRRSIALAKADWQAEAGGLGALRAALLLPMLFFGLVARLLVDGHVHSNAGRGLVAFLLLCGFALGAAAGVVRQVFAVSLYAGSASEASIAA
jgi:hypothetical protein